MTSRLDKQPNFTNNNNTTHVNPRFNETALEATQKEVLDAIKNINLNVGEIVVGDISVQSDDVGTHDRLDTLNSTLANKTLSKTTSSIDISGQTVAISNTGFNCSNIASTPLITNYALETTLGTTNDKLDTLNTTLTNKHLDKTTDSVDISGQILVVNTIEGYATSALQTDTNDVLNELSVLTLKVNNNVEKIVDRSGDIQANIYYTEGAQVWADSVPIPTVNVLNPNGWLYTNTNAGNAMNLFYFNGANEIRRLEEVTGQYAVVSNLSTKINDKMIFGIYTKSSSSFFTTRITHSQPSGSYMVAGGRYLLFWGDAPTDLYPNLPRIDLTDVITTGPANNLEEVLAVSLNSDSGATAGDLSISIEVLGVLFNGESRSYNLLGSPTEYETLVNIKTNSDDIKYKTNLLEFYNESGLNELMTYDRASESNLIDIKTNSDKLKYTGDDLKTVISNTGFNVNNQITGFATETTLNDIKTNTNNLLSLSFSGPGATQLNAYVADGNIAITSLPNVTIDNPSVNYSLESGGNLEAIKTATEATKVNSDKNKYSDEDLKVVFSNTGIAVNTISGFALETTAQATNTKLDTLNTSVNNKTLSKTTSSIDISGQTVAISNTGFKISDGVDTADVVVINTAMIGNQDKGLATVSAVYGAVRNESGLQLSQPITMTSITESSPGKNALDTYDFRVDAKLTTVNTSIGTTNTTLSDIKSQTDKLKFNGDNLKTEVSNQITGFATETTLGAIKTQTDKLVFNGDNLKTEVSNQITGFATETTLGAIKIQTDKLKFNGDNLKAEISNTSFDSKIRDGNNNIITSTVYGIDGVRGLDVSIKNATQEDPLNVVVDTTAALNVSVNNFPTTTQILVGGDTPLSAVASSLYTNLRDTEGDPIGVSGNSLNVEVSNTVVVETGTNPLNVNITGGTIGSDGKAYLYSGDEASSITATTVGAKVGIDSNIINASIDTHNYVSSDGTTWHHLASTATGQLIVEAKCHDGTNNPITSTVIGSDRALDVNVANTSAIPVSGTVGITGTIPVSGTFFQTTQPVSISSTVSVSDTTANTSLSRISIGAGADIFSFAFGNFLNNANINAGAISTTITFTAGDYGRRVMLMYRDAATSSTDSITYYTDSNLGTSESMLLQTVYPIVNSAYRWSNVIVNLLPFTSIKIRNDSATINNTGVYLTLVRV
jgi:hypothetical protein